MINSSIKTKISVAVAALAAVITAAIAFTVNAHIEREFKKTVGMNQFALVSGAAEHQDMEIERSLKILQMMVKGIPVDRLHDATAMERLLDSEHDARLHFSGGFLLVDAGGRILAESPRHADRRGKNHHDREYIRKTLETGKPVVSLPYIAGVPPFAPTISYTAPIFDRSGRLRGLLAGRQLLNESLMPEIFHVAIGRNGYFYLLNQDRTLMMHQDGNQVLETITPGQNAGIDKAIDGFEGSMEDTDFKGVKGISSFKRMKNAPWMVASHLPLEEAYAPMQRSRIYLALTSLAIFLISLLLVRLIVRMFADPLDRLTEHMRLFPHMVNEDRFISIDTGDEFQKLATAFNGMIEQINNQEAERTSLQDKLNEQARFAESLLENTTTPLFVLDATHTVILWNRACCNLTGIPAEDIIGTRNHWVPFYDHPRPCLADLVLDNEHAAGESLYGSLEDLCEIPGAIRAEGWYSAMNGKDRYLYFDAAPVYDSAGKIVAAVETLHDITERKGNERKLLSQKAELTVKHEQLASLFRQVQQGKREWEQTMDCIRDMVIMVDAEGMIIRCNKAVCNFSGLPYEALFTMHWADLFSGSVPEPDTLKNGAGEMYHPGSGRWFNLNTYTMDNRDTGESVITLHDLTEVRKVRDELTAAYEELKSTHTQLLQQEKMASIGQLAAGVAHEINNPMGFISSNLSTLGKYADRIKSYNKIQDEALKDCTSADALTATAETRKRLKIDYIMDDIPKLIAESIEGADRVRTIVQNLKSFSRLDQAAYELVDLNDCLESTLSIAWNELKYKCTVVKEFGVLSKVPCFPQQLNQVFLNLLVNSAHAIEDKGVVTVRTWVENDMACVSIADNGSGIPEEIRARIFEPFFTTKDVGKGTGLGLSISYDIIQSHNGVIDVVSEVGKGTTFTIRLPIEKREIRE